MTRGSLLGRCCTYPQGPVSILPSILSAAALVASFYALPWTPGSWFPEVDFLCVHLDGSDSNYYCRPLRLIGPDYWSDPNDDRNYWVVQLAAFFAILAAMIGIFAALLLYSAVCFSLDNVKLRAIYCSFFACAILSLLTLVAAAFDLCDDDSSGSYSSSYAAGSTSYNSESSYARSSCETVVRLDKGAVAEIFAAVFYLAAAIFTLRYGYLVQHRALSDRDDVEPTVTHNNDKEELLPLHQPLSSIPEAPPKSAAENAVVNL